MYKAVSIGLASVSHTYIVLIWGQALFLVLYRN